MQELKKIHTYIHVNLKIIIIIPTYIFYIIVIAVLMKTIHKV